MGFRRTPLRKGDSAFGPGNRRAKILEDEYDWHGQQVVKVKWLDNNSTQIVPASQMSGTKMF